uniref:SRR1 domain containing n=1 Tax=Varanus komodoensis TaxID=61221 RepID=A0A8D2LWD8_VARKO
MAGLAPRRASEWIGPDPSRPLRGGYQCSSPAQQQAPIPPQPPGNLLALKGCSPRFCPGGPRAGAEAPHAGGARALFASLRKHLAVGQQPAEPVVERALAALEKLQLAVPAPEPRPLAPQEAASGAPGLRCVCYGIGSFSACVKARDQLALLLLLLQELEVRAECCVFDPVFSVLEIEVLRDLGLTVLQENEEGKRPIHEPTVFYMIHCGKALYNNLLWSNWSVEALSKMAIIGNSFRGIQERVPSRIFHKDYSYIAKVRLPHVIRSDTPF